MTRSKRPTLADLWRASLARLERQGAGNAPAEARSLAIAALTARDAEGKGPRDEAEGDVPDAPRARCREMACASS